MYYLCSESKGDDQLKFMITAKLICVFVFAYADNCLFSHVAAHFLSEEMSNGAISTQTANNHPDSSSMSNKITKSSAIKTL